MGSSYNSYGGGRYSYDDSVSSGYGERVPGARRQKMMGYLRAANELRQSYQNSVSQRYLADGDTTVPGAFPDMDVVRTGDEEMLLFPSYARKHIKRKHTEQQFTTAGNGYVGNGSVASSYGDNGDADYWRREWEKHEDENAVVDVDVRGWIYSPQKGPLTRRNRLILAVARRLSGVPAPDQSPSGSRESSQHPGFRAKAHDRMMSREEEAAAREANYIEQRGQKEVDAAAHGAYSANSRAFRSPGASRSTSPSSSSRIGDDEAINKRQSWSLQTHEMSREELLRANEQLMTRLRPFMTLPVADAPITVFFFNDDKSQSKSVTTDESGHFNLRAALDFIPSKVRVLASENLSAVEDVLVTGSQGISLVSDIDDTIKHSAIASGAKEIFKNTFIRDLNDLTISGVKEWYNAVADMGVKLHYVSNSPWQLYPLLKNFFKLTGLPSGSIHLKQYSGMLQGIFEPAAERKRGSLERIMHDFPERKFILVGDSGEADLEVYTDVVVANPGRVLGVYIRDVTTPENSQYADSVTDNDAGVVSQSDQPASRPSLPARPKAASISKIQEAEKDLIDFGDETEPSDLKRSQTSGSHFDDVGRSQTQERHNRAAPNKPAKPSNLRSFSTTPQQNLSSALPSSPLNQISSEAKRTAPPPPKPRKASTFNSTTSDSGTFSQRPPVASLHQAQHQSHRPAAPPRTPSTTTQSSTYSGLSNYSNRDDDGYVASARRHLATAYNALPQIRTPSPARDNMPDLVPRRGLSSYPAAAARWATGASYGDAAGGDATSNAMYNKKEEMWKRRWARSEEIMRRDGVVLRSWRIGSDVMEECIELVRKTQSKLRQ